MFKNKKKFFVHNNIPSSEGQRGVFRCFQAYTQALINAYPGNVSVYPKNLIGVSGYRVVKPFSTMAKNPFIRIPIRFDDLFAVMYANLRLSIYYSPFYGRILTRIPQVFTAYDMIYEKFPQYFPLSNPENNLHIQEKKDCFERAALILCISQNTANDIIDIYPNLSEGKIKVVYLGIDPLFFQKNELKQIDRPYFLYVGNRDKYKNFLRLLTAYGKSELQKNIDLRIVSPVDVNFDAAEMETIRKYRLADRIQIEVGLSDENMRERYRHAHAFVYPSEYEGFGLPVLEALASGTIVLASQAASIPEVGGNIPLYFEPQSEDSIIAVLKGAWSMPESERDVRITGGISRAAQFSWQASQKKFIQTIQSVLN